MTRAFLLLPLLLLVACGQGGSAASGPAASNAPKVLVQVATASTAGVEHTLELTGTVQAGRSVDLVTDVPGKIRQIPVKTGDAVQAGALLARLDTEVARFQYDQAEAAARLADLGLSNAQREFGRAETLHQAGSLPDQQFEQARSALEMAGLQRAQAEAAKGLADKQVRGSVLTAPFDGVVAYVCCEEGEYFNPMSVSPMGGAQGLVGLVDLDTVKIDLEVSDRDVGRIAPGMPAHVRVDVVADRLPPKGLPGTVESVGLAADAASRTFPVRVVAGNPDHVVRAGTHARVRIVLERKDGVVSVPAAAVVRADDGAFVMVAADGVARRTPVVVGLQGNGDVEILQGLAGTEQVVVEGNFGLPDGAPIEVAL